MFTGIIEGKGEVKGIVQTGNGAALSVSAPFDMTGDRTGDSIAVNGICLTAKEIKGDTFFADVSGETLSKTGIGRLSRGEKVNLERAMKAGDRFGGHIVTGHIDGKGTLRRRETRGESVFIEIGAPPDIMNLVVKKGSVAVDGISLTVNDVGKGFFTLTIIPHTLERTNLSSRQPGDSVNIETDIIGKYLERLLSARDGRSGVDMDLLKECGFA